MPEEVKRHRVSTVELVLSQRPDPEWWAHNVVWFDPGGSVIPGSQAQYNKMRQAVKRNKRWISDNARTYSPNLRGPPTSLKQPT